jgi:hypothetical protein
VDHGYLAVETHRNRPGLVRIVLTRELPAAQPADAETRLRYAARFNDGDAALMHTHEILKRRLLDPDSRLYRVPEARAIAAIESLGLSHRDVYFDPLMDEGARQTIDQLREDLVGKRQRKEQLFTTLGYVGIGILLFNLFILSFA